MTTAVEDQPATEAVAERMIDLNAHDRCDRCGSQAYVRVILFSGLDLLFCSHHYAEHAPKLEHYTLRLKDERSLLDTPAEVVVQ